MLTCPLGVVIVDDELTWGHVRQLVLLQGKVPGDWSGRFRRMIFPATRFLEWKVVTNGVLLFWDASTFSWPSSIADCHWLACLRSLLRSKYDLFTAWTARCGYVCCHDIYAQLVHQQALREVHNRPLSQWWFWPCPPDGLPVHPQALQPESYLDTARRCCRTRVIAVSVRNQFDRQWGRQCLSWVERHTATGSSASLTLWTFSLAAAMRFFAFWSLQWALKCHDRLFAT